MSKTFNPKEVVKEITLRLDPNNSSKVIGVISYYNDSCDILHMDRATGDFLMELIIKNGTMEKN